MKRLVSLALILLTLSEAAHSAVVKAVRGTKAILELADSENVNEGDQLFARVKGTKKRKATLTVQSVKGNRAMAEIENGRVVKGERVFTKEDLSSASADDEPPAPPSQDQMLHAFGGLSMEQQDIKLSNSAKVPMTGSGYFARGSKSGNFRSRSSFVRALVWEGGAGIDSIHTTGSISSGACGGSNSCNFDITAISPFGRIGWKLFTDEDWSIQARVGGDALLPVQVSSNVADVKTFMPILFGTVGVWAFIRIDDSSGIPISFDYAVNLSTSSDTSLSRMLVSIGYSWK